MKILICHSLFRNVDYSKKIISINIGVFFLVCLTDLSFIAPNQQSLIRFGALDPVQLALGEWWRLFTASFVHFGIVHLAFNCVALNIIGPQIENSVGKSWFIAIYLFSGVSASLCSSYFNLSLACGASGAIFGLIGVGVIIELFYYKLPFKTSIKENFSYHQLKIIFFRLPYVSLAILNIVLAVLLNYLAIWFSLAIRIDNSAHLGGFFSGASLFYCLIVSQQFSIAFKRYIYGVLPFLTVCCVNLIAGYYLLFTPFIKQKYLLAADSSRDLSTSFFYYSQVLKIDPFLNIARFERGRLFFLNGEFGYAVKEFRFVLEDPLIINKFHELIEELLQLNRVDDALFIRSLLSEKKYF